MERVILQSNIFRKLTMNDTYV